MNDQKKYIKILHKISLFLEILFQKIDIKIDPTQSLEIISALSDHLLRQPASLDATFYHL